MVKLGERCADGNSWGLNQDIGEKKKVKAKPSVREPVSSMWTTITQK